MTVIIWLYGMVGRLSPTLVINKKAFFDLVLLDGHLPK